MKQRVEFGTDGIRGLVGKFPLHRAVVGPIGKAFGQFACRRCDRPTVIIGRDTRPSSVWIADGLVAGLVSQGVDVIQLGIVTTPGVAFVLRRQAADMGLVISASHCPFEYNGIKAMGSRGLRLKRVEEIEIERLIEHCIEHEPPALPRLGEIVEGQHLIDQYIRDHVQLTRRRFGRQTSPPFDGLRLVLDCSDGAAGMIAPRVFTELGAFVHVVNNSVDGISINHACGAEHGRKYPAALGAIAAEQNALCAFAFDGDADRLIVVDRTGTAFDGNDLLYILANYFQAHRLLRGRTVVTNELANRGLEQALSAIGVKTLYVNKGDRNLEAAMWSADYLLGGEDGGNIIFNDGYHTAADAIFTALTLIAVLVDTGTGLKSLAGNLVKRPQILRSFAVPLDAEFYTKMNDKLQHYEAELGPGGRILVWAASTEPGVTRLLVEGGAATCPQIVKQVAEALASQLGLLGKLSGAGDKIGSAMHTSIDGA